MKYKIRQLVCDSTDAEQTLQFKKGLAFDRYLPIVSLGIQVLGRVEGENNTPKFWVNNNSNPILIGYTDIYELDLIGVSQISNLKVDTGGANRVLVDIVYESEE